MRAAIYARKSTDDNDKNADNKSVTRQIERAQAYAEAKGWTVDPRHVFVDDGISGAEYERRPGLVKMTARLKEFDAIVTSENSRIGRDMVRNAVVIDDIRTKGVRLFYYLNDTEERFETPEQRLMATLGGFASEMERAKIAERTRDALLLRAERKQSAGGRCYGYDGVWVFSDGRREIAPPGKRSKDESRTHSDFQINPEEAAVVLAVFQMYADGFGHTAIAKTLNGEAGTSQKRRVRSYAALSEKYFGGRTPPSPEGGTGTWAPSTIRAMLYRMRYAGKLQYGEYHNERGAGGRATKCVKQDKFLIIEREDLRIVPAELWDNVQRRLKATRENYLRENNGTLWGRPEMGRESKYLLSGLARCGCKNGEHVCGAAIAALGGRKPNYYYGCGYYANRGTAACTNDHRERMAVMDDLVLDQIEANLLDDSAREHIIERAIAGFTAALKQAPDEVPKLEAELRKVRKELARFLDRIAEGNAPKSVMAEIARRERRIEQLEREIGRYSAPDVSELDLRRARKDARKMAGGFKDLLRGDVPSARQALRKLLRDADGNFAPLLLVPVVREGRKTYTVRGSVGIPLMDKGLYKAGTEERT